MKGSVMVQGTTSGAGKSSVTMAICRLLANRGIKVAPFKPQNMTDNYYRFEDGKRMAMSQVMEAVACKITPEPRMNPILLSPKPTGGCEVVVVGEDRGDYPRGGYNALKPELKSTVVDCYNSLLNDFDVVVVEGSGSPVELNLWQKDIANMGFASAVDCPVILVGDISRGGVFASLYGTVKLLPEKEQSLIKGLVVNKLKGNREFFAEGEKILEDITGVKTLGVMPYMKLDLEDEDTLTEDGIMKTEEIISARLSEDETYQQYRDNELDKLAAALEESINIDMLIEIIKGGPHGN